MGDTTFAGYISITGILYFISLIYTLAIFSHHKNSELYICTT